MQLVEDTYPQPWNINDKVYYRLLLKTLDFILTTFCEFDIFEYTDGGYDEGELLNLIRR